MHDIVDPRKLRGLQIAATAKLIKRGVVWMVPSQSGNGRYEVSPDAEQPHCTCPDHETRGVKCKHIIAVEIVIERERNADGTTTVTESLTMFERMPIDQLLSLQPVVVAEPASGNQLTLFD